MGTLVGELRYAMRQFWVARVFTATAVLTLALGIGVASLPYRRRRCLLRAGRAAGSLGDVLVSVVRAAQG